MGRPPPPRGIRNRERILGLVRVTAAGRRVLEVDPGTGGRSERSARPLSSSPLVGTPLWTSGAGPAGRRSAGGAIEAGGELGSGQRQHRPLLLASSTPRGNISPSISPSANGNQENKSEVDHVTTGVYIRERLAGIPLADDRVRERLWGRALAELALAWISNK